jgi:hypothetical protein
MNRISRIILSALVALPLTAYATEQVYTWVDDSGTTHFSETPPTDITSDVKLLEVLPASGAGAEEMTDDGFYSVINQVERMQTRRLESEKLAAQKRQADAEAGKARAEAQAALQDSGYNDNVGYYPAYPYYPRYRRHPGHGHKYRPGHGNRPGYPRPSNPRSSLGKTPGMPHY